MSGLSKDDVMKLTLEAGFESNSLGMTYTSGSLPDLLERFATLVAAAEREACAKVCDVRAQGYPTCKWSDGYKQGGAASAAAIRARGSVNER